MPHPLLWGAVFGPHDNGMRQIPRMPPPLSEEPGPWRPGSYCLGILEMNWEVCGTQELLEHGLGTSRASDGFGL